MVNRFAPAVAACVVMTFSSVSLAKAQSIATAIVIGANVSHAITYQDSLLKFADSVTIRTTRQEQDWKRGVVGKVGPCTVVLVRDERHHRGSYRVFHLGEVAEIRKLVVTKSNRAAGAGRRTWISIPMESLRRTYGDCRPAG